MFGRLVLTLLACALLVGVGRRLTTADNQTVDDTTVSASSVARDDDASAPAVMRDHPLTVPGTGSFSDTVSPTQLARVLQASSQGWARPTVGALVHALRLWGSEASVLLDAHPLRTPGQPSTLDILLHDGLCRRIANGQFPQYLWKTPYGVRVASRTDLVHGSEMAEGHVDQLLEALAEAGVPASVTVVTHEGTKTSLESLMADSIARFDLAQELEFSAVAYSRWLAPRKSWTKRFGETITFDDVAAGLCARRFGSGTCDGCHVPYALATLLRVDDSERTLTADGRERVVGRLREYARQLQRSQLPTGGWDGRWSASGESAADARLFDDLHRTLNVTAHHLEWIAVAPLEVTPDKETVRRAVEALIAEIDKQDLEYLRQPLVYYSVSHAARALCLLSTVEPVDEWQRQLAATAK
jgi:hypothetical protein